MFLLDLEFTDEALPENSDYKRIKKHCVTRRNNLKFKSSETSTAAQRQGNE